MMEKSPFSRYRAGLHEAKRALNERLQSDAESGSSAGAAALGAEEWAAWLRCRQVGVPLAAAPGSAALAALAFSVATAVGRAPGAAARAVLDSRASLAASAGLLVFNHQTGLAAPLSERCYVHALAGNSEAGAAMRAAYRAAAGDDDFIAAAEGFARALDGLPPKRAGVATGAAAGAGAGASGQQSRYPRTDFSDRLHAVMQYAPAPTPASARGQSAVLRSTAAEARLAAQQHAAPLEDSRDNERRGFDDVPAPQTIAAATPRQSTAAGRVATAPRWVIDFGDEAGDLDASGRAAPAAASSVATSHDPEPSWAARARRREQLFVGGRGGLSGAAASSGLA